jgi:[protein-PII] uridylyltransferase
METRLLCGNAELLQKMLIKTGPKKIWPSAKFYQGKINEQKARHSKHQDTEYNLEPNVKEAPGWLARYPAYKLGRLNVTLMFIVAHSSVHAKFLSEEEYLTLRMDEEFLWKVRYGLHYLAERGEERLLFDYQAQTSLSAGLFRW